MTKQWIVSIIGLLMLYTTGLAQQPLVPVKIEQTTPAQPTASTGSRLNSLPPGKKPIPVQINLEVDDLSNLNEREESMQIEVTLFMSWTDPRLAFNAQQEGTELKIYTDSGAQKRLTEIWWPQLELWGARGKRETEVLNLTISSDGVVSYREKYRATIGTDMQLSKFPFDKQTVEIRLESFTTPASDMIFDVQSNEQRIRSIGHVSIEEWKVESISAYSSTFREANFHDVFSRYTLKIVYSRRAQYYIAQIIVPLVFVVFLAFSVFWMLEAPLVNRVAILLTSLLTVVVFQWRIFQTLPHVSYHTFLDIFMLISFLVAGSTIIVIIALYHMRHSTALIWTVRILFPLVYLGAVLIAAWYFL